MYARDIEAISSNVIGPWECIVIVWSTLGVRNVANTARGWATFLKANIVIVLIIVTMATSAHLGRYQQGARSTRVSSNVVCRIVTRSELKSKMTDSRGGLSERRKNGSNKVKRKREERRQPTNRRAYRYMIIGRSEGVPRYCCRAGPCFGRGRGLKLGGSNS